MLSHQYPQGNVPVELSIIEDNSEWQFIVKVLLSAIQDTSFRRTLFLEKKNVL